MKIVTKIITNRSLGVLCFSKFPAAQYNIQVMDN